MKAYTLGILFSDDLNQVLLIEKQRPDWQKGLYNFPGGHIEEGETALNCIKREFKEETNLEIKDWLYIGKIVNKDNYFVDVFTSIHNTDEIGQKMTDECPEWVECDSPDVPMISNLYWLIPFAKNIFQQGNHDFLTFGTFEYEFR